MTQTLHLFLILASLLCFDATAQWAWTDKEGRQVFSDRAPPISVPEKSIFQRPGQTIPVTSQELTGNLGSGEPADKRAAPVQAAASSPKAAGVEKDLAERMAKAAQEQAIQRKAEEERISQMKADNCQRARQAKSTLDSGMRLTYINQQGQRVVMDSTARAAEAKRLQSIMDSDCQ